MINGSEDPYWKNGTFPEVSSLQVKFLGVQCVSQNVICMYALHVST